MKNVELDFSKCTYPYDFEIVIKGAMYQYKVRGFPDFYGGNLDAFWDVLTGFIEVPIKFTIIPYKGKDKDASDYYTKIIEILVDAEEYEVYYEVKQQ